MFASIILLALPLLAVAAPEPTTPGGTDKYPIGGNCNIAWTADTTGKWANMNIELMTGNDSPMTHMRTVATVNAMTTTTYSWTCPEVDPTSQSYFYQFSSAEDLTGTLWSTRFLITGTDGSSTLPTKTTANGRAYDDGTFVDPSLYNAQPAYLVGNDQIIGGSPSGGGNNGNGTATPNTTATTPALSSSLPLSTPVALSTAITSPSVTSTPSSSSTGAPGSSSPNKLATSVSSSHTPSGTSTPSSTVSGTTGQTNGAASLSLSTGSVVSWLIMASAALVGAAVISL